MRALKTTLLLLLLFVVACAIWVATVDLDLSAWRPEIQETVREATGRELAVAGSVEVDLLPVPSIVATGLEFGNADWGSDSAMLKARRVWLTLDLGSLLFGRIDLRSVRLDGVELLLETDRDGRGNWEFEGTGEGNGEGETPRFFEALKHVNAIDLKVLWREWGQADHLAEMDLVRLTGNRQGGFDAEIRGVVDDVTREIDARLSSFEAYLKGEGLTGTVRSRTPNLTSTFEGNLGRFPATDGMDLKVTAEGTRWPLFTEYTGLPSGDTPPWELAFRLRGHSGFLDVTEGDASFEGGRITGSLRVNRQGENTRIEDLALEVDATGERWPYLATLIGFPEGPLPPWDVRFRVGGDEDEMTITGIEAQLDQSDLTGELTVRLAGDVPRAAGELKAGLLDLSTPERWWQGTLDQAAVFEATGKVFSREPIQTEWMEAIELDLAIAAETLTTEDLTVTEAEVDLALVERRLEATIEAEVFGGRGDTRLVADAGATPLAYSQRTEILDADMRGVTEEWFGAAVVDAPGRFRYDVRGAGGNIAEIMSDLSGSASLVLGPGTARAGVAERAVRGIATNAISALLHTREVDDVGMECMVSEVKIDGGVAEFEVLVLETEGATVVGKGSINLADETWDLWLRPKPKTFALNAAVPVHMTGPFHAPEITVQKVGVVRKLMGAVSLFVFPPAAVAGLAEFGAGNPCVEILEPGDAEAQTVAETADDPTDDE